MNTQIQIDIVKPEDAEGMRDVVYATWLATYPNEEAGITRDDIEDRFRNTLKAFTPEYIEKRKESFRNPKPGQLQLVARDAGRVIGFCNLVIHEDKNQLQAIYILPEYQGKGIGQMFWKRALEFFDPAKDIVVEVATYNTGAIGFYKKLGFVDTGTRFSDERFTMKSGAVIPEMRLVVEAKKL